MSTIKPRFNVRFKQPRGSLRMQPSAALHEGLMLLSESDEVQPLLFEAQTVGKILTIEVFQSHDGKPILIHFGKEDA